MRPNLVKIAAAAIVRLMSEIHAGGGPEIEFCHDIPIDELPSDLQTVVFPCCLGVDDERLLQQKRDGVGGTYTRRQAGLHPSPRLGRRL